MQCVAQRESTLTDRDDQTEVAGSIPAALRTIQLDSDLCFCMCIQERALAALRLTMSVPIDFQSELPVPEVSEYSAAPASKWQHDLDRQLNAKAVEKSWCPNVKTVSEANDLAPIEFTFA